MASPAIQKRPSVINFADTTSQKPSDLLTKDLCFKIFIVVSIFLAAVVVITGILALMASKGALPTSMSAIAKLSVIGEVNSYVMLSGGIILFVLGVVSWSCHLRKENQPKTPHRDTSRRF